MGVRPVTDDAGGIHAHAAEVDALRLRGGQAFLDRAADQAGGLEGLRQ
jgi:hypothetical protein